MGGWLRARLLLAPLNKDLLCAEFPVLGISELPTSQSQRPVRTAHEVDPSSRILSQPAPQPSPLPIPTSLEQPYHEAAQSTLTPRQPRSQPWTSPEASYCIPAATESAQGDPNALGHWGQVTSFAPGHAGPPLHTRPWWEDHTQGSSLQPQAQPASSDMLGADNEQDGWRTETRAVANSPDHAASAFPAGGTPIPGPALTRRERATKMSVSTSVMPMLLDQALTQACVVAVMASCTNTWIGKATDTRAARNDDLFRVVCVLLSHCPVHLRFLHLLCNDNDFD
jgi:hypothetical protein